MKKVFIFDIDGTLLDSNESHAKAWKEAFSILNKTVPLPKIRSQMGKGSDQFLPEFLNAQELKNFGKELTAVRDAIFKFRYLPHVRPFPKVRELFLHIRQSGARIALASSAKEDLLDRYKKIAHIEDLVEKSPSSDDAQSSKPHPDIFHAALRKLKNPRKETVLVVGDSPFDALAATKAKLDAIGLLCGGFTAKDLRTNGCHAIYKNPADILKNLDEILKSDGSAFRHCC